MKTKAIRLVLRPPKDLKKFKYQGWLMMCKSIYSMSLLKCSQRRMILLILKLITQQLFLR